MAGTEGFNCLIEKLCVPKEHVCDGYPDCVYNVFVFDEEECIPSPGMATKLILIKSLFSFLEMKGNHCLSF